MMNVRQRVFVIVSVIVGLLAAIILSYLYIIKPGKFAAPQAPNSDTATNNPAPAPLNTNVPVQPAPAVATRPPAETQALQLTKIFVERFGTYSNQNGNVHIVDALSLATPEMGKWIKTQAMTQSATYSGQTTVVVASSVTTLSDTAADIHVDTQVHIEGKEDKIVYKSGRVTLAKVGDVWKVSGLYWDKQ